MVLLGSIANSAAIIVGGVVGSIFKSKIKERYATLIIQALSLFIFALGVLFTTKSQKALVVVLSLIIGSLLGEWIDIEKRLDAVGQAVQNRLKGFKGNFSQGFVAASLLYCTGSMAIMGSLQSGLAGQHEILYTKAMMDGMISIVFASTMGIGVAASFLPVFVYQGSITLLAAVVAPFLSQAVVAEMTAAGGVLLMGIGINMLEIKKIKVGNMIPAMFVPILLMLFM